MLAGLRARIALLGAGLVAVVLAPVAAGVLIGFDGSLTFPGLVFVMAGAGLTGLLLAACGAWLTARSVTRSILALDAAARKLQAGEPAAAPVEGAGEIARLAQSFNAMAEAVGERERRMRRFALRDVETDLPNRLALERRLGSLIKEPGPGRSAVAAVSLDRFSQVRRAVGPELASAALAEIGQRLSHGLPGAAVARIGADALGFMLQGADAEQAQGALVRLLEDLEAPVGLPGGAIEIGVTIGVTELSAGDRPSSAIARAGAAVDQARSLHRKIAVMGAEAYGDPAAKLSLMAEMLDAIAAGDLVLHHQPRFDMRERRVTGVEALVRWRHPTRGLLSPDNFVPLAEDTGHIRAMSEWVLDRAIEHQAGLRIARETLEMSVNLSGRLLGDAAFTDTALAMAAKAEGRLSFEITEGAVIDNPAAALANIERLRDAGIGVAIDDYGAGLSSLALLKQVQADELKIDRAFILNLDASQRDAMVVRSTIDLAHSLGLKVTAEGVETDTAYALLAGMGCDIAQGFLIARPMPLDELLVFLREDREASRRYG
jgi:EAL domain-containing protein (putative c-di-GMP-specific phosphodiesterase class I)/GGDEF domain-containing protein